MKNLTNQEIEEKIFFLIKDRLYVEDIKLTDDLINDVGFDSLDLFDVINIFEKEFNICLDYVELFEEIDTVKDIVDIVTKVIKVDDGTYVPPTKEKLFIAQEQNAARPLLPKEDKTETPKKEPVVPPKEKKVAAPKKEPIAPRKKKLTLEEKREKVESLRNEIFGNLPKEENAVSPKEENAEAPKEESVAPLKEENAEAPKEEPVASLKEEASSTATPLQEEVTTFLKNLVPKNWDINKKTIAQLIEHINK